MKRTISALFLAVFFLTVSGCGFTGKPGETIPSTETAAETAPETLAAEPETTAPTTLPEPIPVYEFTDEEKEMLLKIGMAELGRSECPECIALVMRTILNRVESDRFGSSIRSVLFAQDQFTPVVDGSYYSAEPNHYCYEALDMVIYGWDESQGALYYEFCEGESWHSKNLHLLLEHCNTRFYN